ncbi:hypothetical protein BTS2_3031 [Bacillus sp. TS-2]|nr:hypothetical protein BTS2_3031 [Bacillus sp. TS-2]
MIHMVKSMTGYGQAHFSHDDFSIEVEIRSVNHRFFECNNMKLPRRFIYLEDAIRRKVRDKVQRGKLDIYINVEGNHLISKKLEVNWSFLEHYLQTAQSISDYAKISSSLNLQQLMNNDQIVTLQETTEEILGLEDSLLQTVEKACVQLDQMRKKEGFSIEQHFQELLMSLNQSIEKIDDLSPDMVQQQKEKFQKRLEELMNVEHNLDEARLFTEIGIMADKCDISEEISRLRSHHKQFIDSLQSQSPIGRKLDFLVQELNREANTVGAKATDIQIKQQVVLLKSLIEKTKEQVQNIE